LETARRWYDCIGVYNAVSRDRVIPREQLVVGVVSSSTARVLNKTQCRQLQAHNAAMPISSRIRWRFILCLDGRTGTTVLPNEKLALAAER